MQIAKKIILEQGDVLSYQVMIEEVVGMFLARNMNYKDPEDMTNKERAKVIYTDSAYFFGDANYELVIRRKSSK